MGIGAAPEGVISATAIRGLGGVFEGTLVSALPKKKPAGDMIDDDLTRLGRHMTSANPKMQSSQPPASVTDTYLLQNLAMVWNCSQRNH